MATSTIDILIKADDQASKPIKAVSASMTKLSENAGAAGEKMKSFGASAAKIGGAMSVAVTAPIAALGLASINAASDVEESLSKITVVFGENAAVIEAWSQSSSTALGLSQEQALSAAGTFGNLFTSMGLGATETTEMSTGLVDLAADLASFNNIDPTIALEKLKAGMLGQAEPMQSLGVNLLASAVSAKAVAMGLAEVGDELTEQQKMTARYALIMEQTATAQSDFARTSEGLANQQRIVKAQLADVSAEMGAILLPIAVQVVAAVSKIVEAFSNMSPEMQKTIVIVGAVVAAIGPLLLAIGAISTGIGVVLPVLGALGAALGVLLSPIGLVVAAVVGLVAILFDVGGAGTYAKEKLEEWGLEGLAASLGQAQMAAANLVETIGQLMSGEISFGDLTMPQWIGDLMFWKWPELGVPNWITTLFSWAWPVLGPAAWAVKLMSWVWPTLNKPNWIDNLLDFNWPKLPSLPSWMGGDGAADTNATGTSFFRGGVSLVGETGPELVTLPRGSQIYPSGQTAQMAGAGMGGVNININATVANEFDAHVLARQIANIIQRGGY